MVTITLDGVEVSGSPGMTVLELAKETLIDVTQAEPMAPIYVRLHEEGMTVDELNEGQHADE
jgi:hypothetical protein